MTFGDIEQTWRIRGRDARVRITGRALHLFWGDGAGAQTAVGLVHANREMLEDIAAAAEPDDDGVIVIDEIDIEG
jgi:hypothetical protein